MSPTTQIVPRPRPSPTGLRVRPSGPVLFARYAFGPNRLGLCGPEDWRSLLELGVAGASADQASPRALDVDRGLRELAAGFEGAYPYLELIAHSNGLEDPLDPQVVEAYWIGNRLSDRVSAMAMSRSLDRRFRARTSVAEWRWLRSKPEAGARPTHAFHVLDVYPRVGTARGGDVSDALGLMDACRIRWGRVAEVHGDRLVVKEVPLVVHRGRMLLGDPRSVSVQRWLDGTGFVSDVRTDDMVSLHWDWACEVLDPVRLRSLVRRTTQQIEIANQTL